MGRRLKMRELNIALKDLVATDGVNASAVVTHDGIMVEYLNKHTGEAELSLSALIAMMARMAERSAKMLGKGDMEVLTAKADGGIILIERFKDFLFLVAADRGFDFSTIEHKRARVRAILSGMT